MADISQLIQWKRDDCINFDPVYQREGRIWSNRDKSYLIQTILERKPMPEFFFHKQTKSWGKFVYDVVDGKQRLEAIFDFYERKKQDNGKYIFVTIRSPDGKETSRKEFRELNEKEKKDFFEYPIRIYEIPNMGLTDLVDIFIRLNKTGAKLKLSEIRNAEFHGEFITLAKELSREARDTKGFFKKYGVLPESNVKRLGDIELTCELLAFMINGVQHKKSTLYDIIKLNETFKNKGPTRKDYIHTINLIKYILPDLDTTRFRKKSDFYSLFAALYDMYKEGFVVENGRYQKLMRILLLGVSLDVDAYGKSKKTKNTDIKSYYDSTQEGTDTKKNREIRINYIKKILCTAVGKKDKQRGFTEEQKRLLWHTSKDKKCKICLKPIVSWSDLEVDHKKPWGLGNPTNLSNGQIAHWLCNRKKGKRILKRR